MGSPHVPRLLDQVSMALGPSSLTALAHEADVTRVSGRAASAEEPSSVTNARERVGLLLRSTGFSVPEFQ